MSADDRGAAAYDTISFLSDYGLTDEFVGVAHAVIATIAPSVRVVDVTHGIPPHDVRAGGLALARAAPYLPAGVVLAVVDPGVGTGRRAVAIEVGDGSSVLVGPDNGLLSPAVALVGGADRAVAITSDEHRLPRQTGLGATFDGRDVFAPAAAHLCSGVPLDGLGPPVDVAALVPGVLPVSHEDDGDLVAEVLWIDRFGNCQLNLGVGDVAKFQAAIQVSAGSHLRTAERATGYDAIPSGRIGVVVDSSGLVSLSMARRSAATELELHEGAEVRLRSPDDRGPQPGPAAKPVSVTLNRKPAGHSAIRSAGG